MESVNISQATVIAGIVIANLAAIIGAHISTKVSIAKLEVLVDRLDKDVDALGDKIREVEKGK